MSKSPRQSTQQGTPGGPHQSDRALRWLLMALGAVVIFGLGRWMGESSRLADLERSQQALQAQVTALGGRGGAAVPAPASAAAPIGLKTGIDLEIAGMPTLGSESAPVTMIEFSDFQCPFCGRYVRETLPQIMSTYVETGKLRYVFRHLPIDSLHPQAVGAARAAACAHVQGKFWPMHDRLFAHQQALLEGQLTEYARDEGLDMSAFASCVTTAGASTVARDLAAGAGGGAGGTPSFFLGRVQPNGMVRVLSTVYGAKPFPAFQAAYEAALASAQPSAEPDREE